MDELQKFLNRKKEIVKNWKTTGLLAGIENEFEQEQMALVLENQRIDNELEVEARDNPEDKNITGYYPQFRRISIPLVRRIYNPKTFLGFKLVSVQTMMAPEHSFYYRDKYGNLKASAVRAKTRSTAVPIPPLQGGELFTLDNEAKLVALCANELMWEMNREITGDLWANAGSKFEHTYRSREHLEDYIRIAAARVNNRCGFSPNWIVTSTDIAYSLVEKKKPEVTESVRPLPTYAGKLANKWDVYDNPMWPDDRILIGFKGDAYTSGYFYCPYTPVFFNPGGATDSHWDYRIMTRYGKAMPDQMFYGKIELEDYSSSQEELEGNNG